MSIKKALALALSIFIIAGAPGSLYTAVDAPAPDKAMSSAPDKAISPANGISFMPAAPVAYAAQPQDGAGDPNLTVISPRNVNYTTEEVFIGSLERSAGFDARLNYPKTVSVLIPRDGMFVSMTVSGNDWIDEGAPLAVFSVVPNDLEIDESELALELAESAQRRETEALEAALNEARARYAALGGQVNQNQNAGGDGGDVGDSGEDAGEDTSDVGDGGEYFAPGIDYAPGRDYTLRRAELAVLAAEENLEFTIYNGERNLDSMRDHLADLRERSEDFTVYAPISGFVYDLVYFTVGRSVPSGQFICRISNPELFQIVITAPNLTQLRLGAPVSIETSRRDAPTFPGHVIGNTTLLGRNESENRAIIAFNNPQAFIDFGEGSILRLTGLRYRVQIQQADIQNVLLAPRRAINTESAYRFVNILEDGLSKKRYVLVGLTNIEYAQILDGLKAGDVLILN